MAMKKLVFNIPTANSGTGKTFHLPFSEECRLIAARVVPTTAQADSSSVVNFGLASATNWALVADLQNVGARTAVLASWNASATEAEKKQVFSVDEPLDVNINLATASELGLELIVDPFVIGARTSISS